MLECIIANQIANILQRVHNLYQMLGVFVLFYSESSL